MSDSNNKPSRNTPGVISAHELYSLDEFKARMRWTESSYRSARRKGLEVLAEGKRRYIDGGEKAGITVNAASGKFASAHDLRRSFGTRWAKRLKPATLKLLMRHESIETTMKYYVDQDADDVADDLWGSYGAASTTSD